MEQKQKICIVVENQFCHNSGGYGKGRFYVAKIVGKHEKYGLDRKFLNRVSNFSSSSKLTYYSWKVVIAEEGIYEIAEENAFKKYRKYISVTENGEQKDIPQEEVLRIVEDDKK